MTMSDLPPAIRKRSIRSAARMLAFLLLAMTGCASPAFETLGRISVTDPALASVVDPDARIERLAEGFT